VSPGDAVEVVFEVPGLRLAGATWRAQYVASAERLSVQAVQDLALRAWSVVGPFARDFDKDSGPEARLDLTRTYTDAMGHEQRWKEIVGNPQGHVDLLPHFSPNNNCSAYAAVWVRCPSARPAILSVGSDDGVKAWLNRTQVIANNANRGAAPGQDQAKVELRAGWNVVLLKVTQGDGGWGFYCDLLDPATARPCTDLVYSSAPGR
jgi:hypothetical protein